MNTNLCVSRQHLQIGMLHYFLIDLSHFLSNLFACLFLYSFVHTMYYIIWIVVCIHWGFRDGFWERMNKQNVQHKPVNRPAKKLLSPLFISTNMQQSTMNWHWLNGNNCGVAYFLKRPRDERFWQRKYTNQHLQIYWLLVDLAIKLWWSLKTIMISPNTKIVGAQIIYMQSSPVSRCFCFFCNCLVYCYFSLLYHL